MAIVAAPFLLVGILGLVSSSQHWDARRQAQAVASAAARSAAQGDPIAERDGPGAAGGLAQAKGEAADRARDFVAQTNPSYQVTVDVSNYPNEINVSVVVPVEYVLSGFGLPAEATGSARSVPLEGVQDGNRLQATP